MSILGALARIGLVASLKARAANSAHRFAFSVAMGGCALLLFLVALGFVAFAGFLALVPGLGPIGAALVTAGVALVLAVVMLWVGIPGTRPGVLRSRSRPAASGIPGAPIAAATGFAAGFLTGHGAGQDCARR